LSRGSFPPTRRRHIASHGELKHSSSSRVNSTNRVRQAYSCGASLEIKAGSYSTKSMPTRAGITLVQGHLSGKLSDKDSTGPQQWWTPRTSCAIARGASSTLGKLISRRIQTIPITWPLAVWNLDMVGPL
jgi:hypothetical protein